MKVCLLLLCLIPLFSLSGCARFPEQRTDGPRGKQLVVSMTVRGRIRQDAYHYFVLINQTDDPNDPGPVPVVDIPWGNGFAAPSRPKDNAGRDAQGFNAFVSYDLLYRQGSQTAGGNYGLWRVNGPAVFSTNFEPLGLPDVFAPVREEDNTLSFQLNLARLRLSGSSADPRYVQINLLTTNNLPRNDDDPAVFKLWDALGDGRDTGTINTWITIPIDQDSVRTNRNTNLEPSGDVREKLGAAVDDPDLDITDWRVEIRSE